MNGGWGISYEIAIRWMLPELTDDKSTLVQVMAWCRQATNHYLSQCWPRSISPNAVTRPQWAKLAMEASLQWRHNGRYGVSNHQPHYCLRNRIIRSRSKKISKLCITGLCVGNSPVTNEFPAQMSRNTENVSIWWRHHVLTKCFSSHLIST